MITCVRELGVVQTQSGRILRRGRHTESPQYAEQGHGGYDSQQSYVDSLFCFPKERTINAE